MYSEVKLILDASLLNGFAPGSLLAEQVFEGSTDVIPVEISAAMPETVNQVLQQLDR